MNYLLDSIFNLDISDSLDDVDLIQDTPFVHQLSEENDDNTHKQSLLNYYDSILMIPDEFIHVLENDKDNDQNQP